MALMDYALVGTRQISEIEVSDEIANVLPPQFNSINERLYQVAILEYSAKKSGELLEEWSDEYQEVIVEPDAQEVSDIGNEYISNDRGKLKKYLKKIKEENKILSPENLDYLLNTYLLNTYNRDIFVEHYNILGNRGKMIAKLLNIKLIKEKKK